MLAASGGANNRRFGNYNEEVSHFPAKRIFYAAAVSVDGGGDDHSFSFSTHATEWAWDYGADGERRAGGFYYPHEREIFVKSEAESSAVRRENAAHRGTAAATARKLY